MGTHLSTLIRPAVAIIAFASMVYLQSNKFVRRRQRIEYPRRNLSQLPEELILEIFRAVHDTPIPNSRRSGDEEWTRYHRGTRDIQNIRLTCKKFDRISSELLIRFVGVDLSVESLDRLHAIMSHPTIGRGVGTVRIRLAAYDWNLYKRPDRYVEEMRSHLACYMYHMDGHMGMLATWYALGWELRTKSVVRKFRAAADTGHQEYKRRFEEQYELPNHRFINWVSHALGKSRKPLSIEITDRNDFMWSHSQSVYRATQDNLLAVIARPRPSTWQDLVARCHKTSRDNAWMIPVMLEGFADSGVPMAGLHFDLTRTMAQVMPVKMDSGVIKAAVRDLRNFTYHNDHIPETMRAGPEWRSVLYKCLPPASLRDLMLRRVRLEPMSQCPSLTRITLKEVEFDLARLIHFLEPLEPHAVDITLDECFLNNINDDSWADVLDVLRSKQRWTRLDSPSGLDLDGMSPENHNYLFVHLEDWYGGASKAEQYIRGSLDVNPVRQHHDY